MSNQRSRLFEDSGDDLDLSEFQPKKPPRPEPAVATQSAKVSGFKSREPKPAPAQTLAPLPTPAPAMTIPAPSIARAQRRHRTGRNAQLNLKAKPETIEAFYAIADAHNWVLGEALEKAVELLEKQYSKKGKS